MAALVSTCAVLNMVSSGRATSWLSHHFWPDGQEHIYSEPWFPLLGIRRELFFLNKIAPHWENLPPYQSPQGEGLEAGGDWVGGGEHKALALPSSGASDLMPFWADHTEVG